MTPSSQPLRRHAERDHAESDQREYERHFWQLAASVYAFLGMFIVHLCGGI